MKEFNSSNINDMDIETYLTMKNIVIIDKKAGELVAHCPFGSCDDDSVGKEGHFYIDKDTGLYYCHKCGAKGNKVDLAKHFGDWKRTSWLNYEKSSDDNRNTKGGERIAANKPSGPMDKTAKLRHEDLSMEAKEYLQNRGLSASTLEYAKIGETKIHGRRWLTIPITEREDKTNFLKLRCWPGDEELGPKYLNYPGGNTSTLYGGWELLHRGCEETLITEGEFDRLVAYQNGLPFPVSSTAGASTFKDEWIKYFEKVKVVYVSMDNDEQGEKGAQKIIDLFTKKRPDITVFKITYPNGIKDMTDAFLSGFTKVQLLEKCSKYVCGPKPIDPSSFHEMNLNELADILDTTIKYDWANKCIIFLAMLTAYTENDQLNIYLTGPSSTGKTYLMEEIAEYFPDEDKEMLAQASPTAFKHRRPVTDIKTGKSYVDLERKILMFQDVPNFQLMETLRPLLSHDKKEITYLTTDRGKQSEFSCKESVIRGFPSCIICSAKLNMDEQESTRAIVLTPEISKEKITAGKKMANERSANPKKFEDMLSSDARRKHLVERVRYIKSLQIDSAIIPDPDITLKEFDEVSTSNQARAQRDIMHFNSLAKAVAMLNAPYRMDGNGNIIVKETDIKAAAKLWKVISRSTELGISPYIYNFYRTFILPTFNERNNGKSGITRLDIIEKYYSLTRLTMDDYKLRKEIIPALKVAKLIKEVRDEENGRVSLIIPLLQEGDDCQSSKNSL